MRAASSDSAMLLPKPCRERDAEYLRWVKDQPEWCCLITGRRQAVACHLTSV